MAEELLTALSVEHFEWLLDRVQTGAFGELSADEFFMTLFVESIVAPPKEQTPTR